MRKKNKEEKDIRMAEGVLIRPENWKQEENRLYTLLLKSVFVYSIVMGTIGCYLTSLKMTCSYIAIHLVVLLGAVFCCLLYYNKVWENVGYILLFILLLFSGVSLRAYISTGFLATLNELGEQSSVYFGSKAIKRYAESVGNRELAVTLAFCYIGWVACVLMNVLISRRMQYMWATLFCILALIMPLYIENEPAGIYVIMLFSGLITCFVIRGNGHYHLTHDNAVYEFLPKKKRIEYVYAGKSLAGGMLSCFVICVCLIAGVFAFFPQERYEMTKTKSALKEKTMGSMQNFLQLGVMGLFNRYQSTGGLTSGRLGGISSIQLDYETDLVVTYAPYDNQRLYLKNFMGATYLPYENRWEYLRTKDHLLKRIVPVDGTSSFYRERYEKKDKNAAKGKMDIQNIAADERGYLPYYSENVNQIISPNEFFSYTYYTYNGKPPKMKKEYVNRDHPEQWLAIPNDNREAIQTLCGDAGLDVSDTPEEMATKLTTYFQKNIPYTYSPGATPRRQDFINYFLGNNRKGYCAHFASSATLAFRAMGVPARYVEGYAIDLEDLSEEGEIAEDKKYEDYYDGYNKAGNTSVVSVNVTDGNAHAWVEIYDEDSGWKVADVTPAAYGEEKASMGLMQRLMQLFQNSGSQSDGEAQETTAPGSLISPAVTQTALQGVRVVLVVIVVLAVIYILQRQIRKVIRYCRGGVNDRVIMKYGKWLRKKEKKYPELKQCLNYRQQIETVAKRENWQRSQEEIERIIRLLEKAGFSKETLTQEEKKELFFRI